MSQAPALPSRESLNPRDPAFYQDPYRFYADVHAQAPAFTWTNYGHACFAGFDDVNVLLRDRRFGRQILHVASREELAGRTPNRTSPPSTIPRNTRCWRSSRRTTPACAG